MQHNYRLKSGSVLFVTSLVVLLIAGEFLIYGAAYNVVVSGTNTVFVPNDAGSPYKLSSIASDIGNSTIFAWHADSNTAVCAASISISGTVHIGKVNLSGGYDAGGNEEKLLMVTNSVFVINIESGGALISRGTQGAEGVRRDGTDVLTNEISVIPRVYPRRFRIEAGVGGTILLHDTKISWCAGSAANWPGLNLNGSEFDIRRCQLYTYQHYSPAVTIDPSKSYANPVFRDNYIGGGHNASVGYNRPGLRLGWYTASSSTNIEIINCEFDANDTTEGGITGVGNILNFYSIGVRVIDCTFSRGCPVALLCTAAIPADMELRNCDFKAEAVRYPFFSGDGNADTWMKYTHYLSAYIVNNSRPEIPVQTVGEDVFIKETSAPNGLPMLYKSTGSGWGSATNRVATRSGPDGWTPSPGSAGAVMLTEMVVSRAAAVTATNYYYYNLAIAEQINDQAYFYYDYHAQHGNRYITSVDEGGAEDNCIGSEWYRADGATPNPLSLINQSPTNGTWYIGMEPKPRGTIFTIR